jgi:hypothetical protein
MDNYPREPRNSSSSIRGFRGRSDATSDQSDVSTGLQASHWLPKIPFCKPFMIQLQRDQMIMLAFNALGSVSISAAASHCSLSRLQDVRRASCPLHMQTF